MNVQAELDVEKIQEKIKNLTYWLQETSHLNEEEARQEAIKLYTTLNDEPLNAFVVVFILIKFLIN